MKGARARFSLSIPGREGGVDDTLAFVMEWDNLGPILFVCPRTADQVRAVTSSSATPLLWTLVIRCCLSENGAIVPVTNLS